MVDGGIIVVAAVAIVPMTTSYASFYLFRAARRARETLARMVSAKGTTVAEAAETAANGPLELNGMALPLDASAVLNAPLSGLPCLWWRVEISEANGSSITRIATESAAVDFYLDDGSGSLARIRTERVTAGLVTRNIDPGHEEGARRLLAKLGIEKSVASLLWSEERIDPHAEVYVVGQALPPETSAASGGGPFRPQGSVRERLVLEAPEDGALVLSVGVGAALTTKLRAEERSAARQGVAFGAIAAVFWCILACLAFSVLGAFTP